MQTTLQSRLGKSQVGVAQDKLGASRGKLVGHVVEDGKSLNAMVGGEAKDALVAREAFHGGAGEARGETRGKKSDEFSLGVHVAPRAVDAQVNMGKRIKHVLQERKPNKKAVAHNLHFAILQKNVASVDRMNDAIEVNREDERKGGEGIHAPLYAKRRTCMGEIAL